MTNDRTLLVYSTFVVLLSLFIFASGPFLVTNLSFLLIQVFSLLLILWSFISRKVNKHHHGTKLPDKIFYISHGPYEIIRHPIYAGFLLLMSGHVQGSPGILRFVAFALLCLVCLLKLLREEYILEHYIQDYDSYKKKTKMLIPYFF